MLRRVASWVVLVGAVVGLGGCLGGPQTDPPGLHDNPTDTTTDHRMAASDGGVATTDAGGLTGLVGAPGDAGAAPDAGAPPSAGFDTDSPGAASPGDPLRQLPPLGFLSPAAPDAGAPEHTHDRHHHHSDDSSDDD